MKLVSDWKDALKWYSTHASALVTALLGAWLALPQQMQNAFGATELKIAALILVILGFAGRMIDQ